MSHLVHYRLYEYPFYSSGMRTLWLLNPSETEERMSNFMKFTNTLGVSSKDKHENIGKPFITTRIVSGIDPSETVGIIDYSACDHNMIYTIRTPPPQQKK